MNALTSRNLSYRSKLVWFLSCGTMCLLITAVVAAAQRGGSSGGAEPYSPTRGEWLCVLLNARQALSNSEQVPHATLVHYFYDRSTPNVIFLKVLADKSSDKAVVRRILARAKEHAIATAKIYGWQDWLQVEQTDQEFTEDSAAASLIH